MQDGGVVQPQCGEKMKRGRGATEVICVLLQAMTQVVKSGPGKKR